MKAQSEKKHGSDKEERAKLPESPKTAEEIWQQSVIGDYLARFKVRSWGWGLEREEARTTHPPHSLLETERGQSLIAGSVSGHIHCLSHLPSPGEGGVNITRSGGRT